MSIRRGLHLRIFLLLAPIALLLLTGCTTRAASPGRLFVTDETERLRQLEVAKAAAPLVQRGVKVVVLIVQRGDNNGDDLTYRLTAINQGYSSRDRIPPDAIAIYVSYEPRYAELRAGKNWSDALTDDVLTDIRTRALNPALRSDDVTDGVAETLRRFESTLMWRDIKNLIIIAIIVIIVIVVILIIVGIVRSLLSGNIQWSSGSSDDPSEDWSYSSSSRSSLWDSSSDDSRSWGSSSSDSSGGGSGSDSSSSGGSW
ncbi:TPM domain-containing protein [Roseiflexus sp.]